MIRDTLLATILAFTLTGCGSLAKAEERLEEAEQRLATVEDELEFQRKLTERLYYHWRRYREMDEAEREAWRRALRAARGESQ